MRGGGGGGARLKENGERAREMEATKQPTLFFTHDAHARTHTPSLSLSLWHTRHTKSYKNLAKNQATAAAGVTTPAFLAAAPPSPIISSITASHLRAGSAQDRSCPMQAACISRKAGVP